MTAHGGGGGGGALVQGLFSSPIVSGCFSSNYICIKMTAFCVEGVPQQPPSSKLPGSLIQGLEKDVTCPRLPAPPSRLGAGGQVLSLDEGEGRAGCPVPVNRAGRLAFPGGHSH